jgi:pimeloyl-ACP methyl ester carboxylesterase
VTTTQFISFQEGTLAYTKAGSGKNPLLLFHGFGQTKRAFEDLVEVLGTHYTLYSFDLFFHGESTWNLNEQPLHKITWKEMMAKFLQAHAIDAFSVMGFSMGGKFALVTLEAFPEKVKEIFLLAPDGIKTSFWYSLATYPLAFRKLFKSMINHPGRFHAIATNAHRLRIIDRGLLRFTELQMNTFEKRQRVYLSWVVFRHLTVHLPKVATLVRQYDVKLTLLVGRYDKVITARNMNRLTRQLYKYRFEIVEAGHNDLIEKAVPYLKSGYF